MLRSRKTRWGCGERRRRSLFSRQNLPQPFSRPRASYFRLTFFFSTSPLSESLALVFISPREHKGCFQNSPPGKSFSPLPPDMRGWKPGKPGKKFPFRIKQWKAYRRAPILAVKDFSNLSLFSSFHFIPSLHRRVCNQIQKISGFLTSSHRILLSLALLFSAK